MESKTTQRARSVDLVYKEFQKVLASGMVSTSIVDRLAVSHGVCPPEFKWMQKGQYPYLPDMVVWPEKTEDVSKMLKIANRHKMNVIPYGGGSGSVMGTVFYKGGICLDMKRLLDFELNPKGLWATVGVGWNLQHLEDRLNSRGFTTGHFPQSLKSATVGGSIATIAIGTFSTKYGKYDDMLLSLEAVLPTGEIIHTRNAPKKSCGLNLNHLFLGSEGSFGVCTEATIKVWPMPETRKYTAYTFPTTHDGLEAIRSIIVAGVFPAVVRLYDEAEAVFNIDRFGYEKGYSLLLLGFEGRRDMVSLEMEISEDCCRTNNGNCKGGEAALHWERDRFSTAYGLDTSHMLNGACDSVEVSAPWDKLEDVWLAMRNKLAPYAQIIHSHFSHMYHTGGNIYCIIHAIGGSSADDSERRFLHCVDEAIKASVDKGGSVSHHHGIGTLKSKWMSSEHASGLDAIKKIKKALDPNSIMNAGVLGIGEDQHE